MTLSNTLRIYLLQLQLQGGLATIAAFPSHTIQFIIAPEGDVFQTKTEVSYYAVLRLLLQACRSSADLYLSAPSCNVLVSGPVGSNERMALNKAVFKFGLGRLESVRVSSSVDSPWIVGLYAG